MARPKKSASPLVDPLFAAMIAKLPSSDKDWDVDKQVAWLNMMAMAFGTVYGGNAAERLACKCHDTLPASTPHQASAMPAAPVPKFQRANGEGQSVSEPKPISHAFYIDKEGMARNKKGDRIMPGEVSDFIVDLRGETGDLDAIVWADNSVGLPRDRSLDVTLG